MGIAITDEESLALALSPVPQGAPPPCPEGQVAPAQCGPRPAWSLESPDHAGLGVGGEKDLFFFFPGF